MPEAFARAVHAAIEHDVSARIQDCAAFAARVEEAIPEAVTGLSGPFTAVQLARLAAVEIEQVVELRLVALLRLGVAQ